ncbi:DUF3313 domain-containing protein [Rhizobium straminoryzae]|uniref:DUF3313 domain-containing protein n=2 Tax=Rhizobium straminoryzae TaxID=1387186 RepID=A0A549T7Q7_9HYPH|nr:DUF3313 domain-containing protein [Rhizobium straminoryzae]
MSGTRNKHAPAEWQGWSLPVASFLSIGMALAASGCSSVPLREAGSLSSYSRLGPEEGRVAKSRSFADRSALLSATTVSIQPARLGPAAAARVHDAEQERLVSNALDRALCIGLSDRFRVVGPGERADLTVRSTITDIVPTGTWAAGVSKVATLGTSAVLPVGVPRLPIGLGGLAVEAEAVDAGGAQRAAILWSRGANSITNSPRVSEIGDAYGLANTFAGTFAQILVKGETQSGVHLDLPSGQKLKSQLGGAPKYAACEAFGRAPGVGGFVASAVGAPPSWTDKAK